MATPRTSRSWRRIVGWLLGLMAVIIDGNLNAQDGSLPVARPGDRVAAMKSPESHGPAPIVDKKDVDGSIVDEHRFQETTPKNSSGSIFDFAPPLPRISNTPLPETAVNQQQTYPSPAPTVDRTRVSGPNGNRVAPSAIEVSPPIREVDRAPVVIDSKVLPGIESKASSPARIVDKRQSPPMVDAQELAPEGHQAPVLIAGSDRAPTTVRVMQQQTEDPGDVVAAPIVDKTRVPAASEAEVAAEVLGLRAPVTDSKRHSTASRVNIAPTSNQLGNGPAPIVDKTPLPAAKADHVAADVLGLQGPTAEDGIKLNERIAAPIIDKRQVPRVERNSSTIAPATFDISPPTPPPGIGSPFVDDNTDVLRSIISGDTSPVLGDGLGSQAIVPGAPQGYLLPKRHGLLGTHPARRIGEIERVTTDPRYDRVLDLYGADRDLIEQVREVVEQTEVGVDTTDERWISIRGDQITWGGRVELDAINWVEDEQFLGSPPAIQEPSGQQNYFEFRRLRLFAAGEGYGVFDYQLELDFAENDVRVKDAYIGISQLPILGYAMLGHFRIPIGLENRTSSRYIPFMERGLPTSLVPGRELGVAFFNQTPSQRATWAFGAFVEGIDEADKQRVDDNQGTRAVARVTWTPLYDEASLGTCFLHTGAGYLYTRPRFENSILLPPPPVPGGRRISFSSRPEISRGDRLVDTGTLFVDQYHTGNVEMAYGNGPLTLQSELTWTAIENTGGGTSDLYGAYAYASWFLTGERRPYERKSGTFGRVIPYENFWVVDTGHGKRAGLGAWEFALRWSYLSFDDINNQYLHDITAGINWYWNPHTRMMINWIHPIAHNSDFATDPNEDAHGDILALRMAFDF